jgi:hypothetical protein
MCAAETATASSTDYVNVTNQPITEMWIASNITSKARGTPSILDSPAVFHVDINRKPHLPVSTSGIKVDENGTFATRTAPPHSSPP